MTSTPPRPRRIPAEQRVRPMRDDVRANIRSAATQHFLAVGYRAARLETIAQAAGYTKGAIYSNFASKQGLFLDLLAARIDAFSADIEALALDADSRNDLVALLTRRLAHEVIYETAWHVLVVEFAAAAVTDDELTQQYANLQSQRREDVVGRLHLISADITEETAHAAATALLATVNGLSVEVAANRSSITEHQVATALNGVLQAFLTPPTSAE